MSDTKDVRCRRCNRLLKTEVAQQRGYGPLCFRKIKKENMLHQKDLFNLPKGKNN